MTDELVKHCMCGCMHLETECPNCNKVTDAATIARLRAWDGTPFDDDAEAAADRIKALVKERDATNALLREAFDAGSDHGWDQAKQDECGGTEPLTPDEAFAAFLDAHLGAKP